MRDDHGALRASPQVAHLSEGNDLFRRLRVVPGAGELEAEMRVLPRAPAEPLLADDLQEGEDE